jgi:hypothetical protein
MPSASRSERTSALDLTAHDRHSLHRQIDPRRRQRARSSPQQPQNVLELCCHSVHAFAAGSKHTRYELEVVRPRGPGGSQLSSVRLQKHSVGPHVKLHSANDDQLVHAPYSAGQVLGAIQLLAVAMVMAICIGSPDSAA